MKLLNKLEELIVLSALSVMGIVLIIQVFMRFVLNYPLVWSEELARYIFVWLTFLGAGYGVKNNIHIRLEAFYEKFPESVQNIVTVLTNILAIMCFMVIIYYGVKFTISQNAITSSAMGIPMSYVIISVPIGCSVIVLRLLSETINVLKKVIRKEER